MRAKFVFLGTGASAGVPVIGCECSVCRSTNGKNRRLRPSGLLQVDSKQILIDVGPDFRYQALKYGIRRLDGLLLTHTHYDHIAGIDELRIFYLRQNSPLPCLLSLESLDNLKSRYTYLFRPLGEVPTLSAQLELHVLDEEIGEVDFLGIRMGYCSYSQGGMGVTGWRWGDFAYLTDVKEYDPSVFVALKGVKTLVINALRQETSPLHLTIDEAIAFGRTAGAEKIYLTHLSHSVDYESVQNGLPQGVFVAYDGLELTWEFERG